ncbi:MAG: dienelactone hydrolase family protein [Nitrosopumilus sp.]|nr:dienelactone hydrolase family protein [Nitrosopumilus sp.]
MNHKINENSIIIPIKEDSNDSKIEGNLTVPKDSKGLVIFAHGSGSGRHSPRNQYVAEVLNNDGVATLLLDLLTEEEEKVDVLTGEYRFNIDLLADRLISVTDWILKQENTKKMILGYFGASTGAAATLIAADKRPDNISAIVSRGGRVDLSSKYSSLNSVNCPTLFIVGEKDKQIIEFNKKVLDTHLEKVEKKKIVIIPGASHLFEEQGKLEEVAKKASGWFRCYFQIKEQQMNNNKN